MGPCHPPRSVRIPGRVLSLSPTPLRQPLPPWRYRDPQRPRDCPDPDPNPAHPILILILFNLRPCLVLATRVMDDHLCDAAPLSFANVHLRD